MQHFLGIDKKQTVSSTSWKEGDPVPKDMYGREMVPVDHIESDHDHAEQKGQFQKAPEND